MDRGQEDLTSTEPSGAEEDRYARRARADCLPVLIWQGRAGSVPPEPRRLIIEPGRPTHVSCDNPDCRGGGLDPLPLIRELIDDGAGELRVSSCEGRLHRDGNGRGARCDTMFCVSLATITRD